MIVGPVGVGIVDVEVVVEFAAAVTDAEVKVPEVELTELVTEEDEEFKSFLLYKLNLLPAPQYSSGFPAHFMRHSMGGTGTAPLESVFPHQHSLLKEVLTH